MLIDTRKSPNAKLAFLPAKAVRWQNGFWKEVVDTCAETTVPAIKALFENAEISHVVDNFKIATGEKEGAHEGTPFGDGDFYKWMEAAIYAADEADNDELWKQVDAYIALIGRAQQPDGYISTKQIIGEKLNNGIKRQGDIDDFEVYNIGHLLTVACLHHRITGKDNLMQIAAMAADYLERLYREAKESGEVQTAVCPSHYMGLVEMYRTTKEKRYLELVKLAIELRDSVKNGKDDNQDRIPLRQHEKIVGHAVRANYLYAGVADLCLEENNEELEKLLDKMWKNLTEQKIYITGGCGALYNGASPYGNFWIHQLVHQAYGYEYQLPNITAYNETCAALGAIFWALRMFARKPKAQYFDMIERIFLNTGLGAINLQGNKFFYENALRRAKNLPYELCWPLTRSEYITSFCCPPNLARTLAESAEYVYAQGHDSVYTGLYGANRAEIVLRNGAAFTLVQKTEYPWNGTVRFTVEKADKSVPVSLMLRIPAWLESGTLKTAKETVSLSAKDRGYKEVRLAVTEGETVDLVLDMPARYTVSHPLVEETANQVAVERGPLVYCMESPDVSTDTLDNVILFSDEKYQPIDIEISARRITALKGKAGLIEGVKNQALYSPLGTVHICETEVNLIPYFAWDNRGNGEMKIWMPVHYRE